MPFIYATDIENFLDPTSKMQLDYLVVALTVVQWLRFYSFFYVI